MELTPKQQAIELIRQAEKILLVTSREPNNDQIASLIALQTTLTKIGKQTQAVVSDNLPKVASILDTKTVSSNLEGVRDFVVTLDTKNVEVDSLKYNSEGDKLKITITPHSGNFTARDASFDYGAFQFDLVITIGVTSFDKLDRIIDKNPTIFDDLHVINIDYHRINDNWGSVNVVDGMASSVSEMLVSIIESLEQGVVDEKIATALLAGIMAATNRFSGKNTTPKSMTVAAQLMAAGAHQQDVVKALFESNGYHNHLTAKKDENGSQDVKKKFQPAQNQPKKITESSPQNQQNLELLRERLAKLQKTHQNMSTTTTQPKAQDHLRADSMENQLNKPKTQTKDEHSAVQTFDSANV